MGALETYQAETLVSSRSRIYFAPMIKLFCFVLVYVVVIS